jgi:hypothetical protein
MLKDSNEHKLQCPRKFILRALGTIQFECYLTKIYPDYKLYMRVKSGFSPQGKKTYTELLKTKSCREYFDESREIEHRKLYNEELYNSGS